MSKVDKDLQKQLDEFFSDMQEAMNNFKADIIKTIREEKTPKNGHIEGIQLGLFEEDSK